MKFTAVDLNRIVESLAPSALALSWDNVGFQIGRKRTPVRRVLCALEVTPEVLKETQKRNAQALIVHHPLIFRPPESITDATPTGRLIMDVTKAGICLIVAHTNLDKSPYGTNRALAELIGLCALEFLEPEATAQTEPQYGMGYIGGLQRTLCLKAFASLIKRRLGIKYVQVVGNPGRKVKRVAILTGAGGDVVGLIRERGVDVLVTGEINHHSALDARTAGIAVICAGHFATEVIGMNYFADALKDNKVIKKAGVEIMVARHQSCPYEYF